MRKGKHQHRQYKQRRLLAKGIGARHHADANRGQQPTVHVRAAHLVHNETVHRIRHRNAVNQHNRVNRQPIHQRRGQATLPLSQRSDDLQHVQTLHWRRRHDPRIHPVRKEHHWANQDRRKQERPEAEGACVDRQKEDTGADGGAKQRNRPRPGTSVRRRGAPRAPDLALIRHGKVFKLELVSRDPLVLIAEKVQGR
ncbi:hypothetical protein CIP107550_02443 [Corynebacterium diphtheriae]|nr:hypothetical protein CIP107550_02443 [Corynebacterium diphtheriae]